MVTHEENSIKEMGDKPLLPPKKIQNTHTHILSHKWSLTKEHILSQKSSLKKTPRITEMAKWSLKRKTCILLQKLSLEKKTYILYCLRMVI